MKELAECLGCTHQNVSKRAKRDGWTKAKREFAPVAQDSSLVYPTRGSELGTRSPENIQHIINTYAVSGNKSLTAGVVGIDRETLRRWVAQEPELAAEMEAARKQHLVKHYNNIANAGERDWKASKEILARAPETKDDWGEVQKEGPTIVLNIVRD